MINNQGSPGHDVMVAYQPDSAATWGSMVSIQ